MLPFSLSKYILLVLLSASCILTTHGKGVRIRGGGGGGWGQGPVASSLPNSSVIASKVRAHAAETSLATEIREEIESDKDFYWYSSEEFRAYVDARRAQHEELMTGVRSSAAYARNRDAINAQKATNVNVQKARVNAYIASSGGAPSANYPRQKINPHKAILMHSTPLKARNTNITRPGQHVSQQALISTRHSQLQGNTNAHSLSEAIDPNAAMSNIHSSPLGNPSIQIEPKAPEFYSRPQSGIPNANNPRSPNMPPQTLGSGVWNPKSGNPSPVYMNYGGLPTGANMYTMPLKKKGFLGSLISMGSYKSKHYRSHPNPYGVDGEMPSEVLGTFLGDKGSKRVMYTILPYMAARKSSKLFKPKFGFYKPIYSSHYHMHDTEYDPHRYDVFNDEYVGSCNRPIKPGHAGLVCIASNYQVNCYATCEQRYSFADNTTSKVNKCWHVTGSWNPVKNFPACEPVCNKVCLNGGKCVRPGVCGCPSEYKGLSCELPVCNEPCLNGGKCARPGVCECPYEYRGLSCELPVCNEVCLNGGKCIRPGVCECPSEYRGLRCELHFLKCDIRNLANGMKIRWACTHTKNETWCRVICRPPAEFVTPPEEVYRCTPEGAWTPNSLPQCL